MLEFLKSQKFHARDMEINQVVMDHIIKENAIFSEHERDLLRCAWDNARAYIRLLKANIEIISSEFESELLKMEMEDEQN